MTPIVEKFTRNPLKAGCLAFALIAAAALPSLASTASNTTITNIATVNFSDAGGVAQAAVTASASVTVTLVPSALNISSPANVSVAQGNTADLSYTITATANGPDTYSLVAAETSNNVSGVPPTFPAGNPISLGATTLAANAAIGATTITVPYDGNASNAAINGLTPGQVIVIGGNPYTIAAAGINKTTSTTTNTVVITLTSAIAGAAGTAGQVVPQQLVVHVLVPSGAVTSGASGTQTIALSGTSTTDNTKTGTQGTPTVVTVNRPTLTVTKSVSTDNGTSFGATGVAPPGTSLIYKITATNTGSTAATLVQFTDVVPLFLTYVNGSGKFATLATTTYAAAAALTEGTGGYTFTPGTSTANYNPGGAGGTVAGGGVLILFFRATIN